MIRKKTPLFKLLFLNKSGPDMYEERIKKFHAELEVCENCHVRGKCINFDTYERHCVDYINGKIIDSTVTVRRVICGACGCTHAILSDYLIPYNTHSVYFILKVLAYYFCGIYTVEKICSIFEISVGTLYNWKALFLKHKSLWLGLLRDLETSPFEFTIQLIRLDPFSTFEEEFVKRFKISFLQHHCNPPPRKLRAERE